MLINLVSFDLFIDCIEKEILHVVHIIQEFLLLLDVVLNQTGLVLVKFLLLQRYPGGSEGATMLNCPVSGLVVELMDKGIFLEQVIEC